MKSILVVSDNYPSAKFPARGIFVYQIIQKFAENLDVTVISPKVVFKGAFNKKQPYGNEKCKVIRPVYLGFSDSAPRFLKKFSRFTKRKVVENAANRFTTKFNLIYTHFLWNAIICLDLKKQLKIPLVAALGESDILRYERYYSLDQLRNFVDNIDGFLIVSEKIKKYCCEKLLVPENKIFFAPNGVDANVFFPMDKIEIRNELKLPENEFIISFLGAFIQRKGINELMSAIKELDGIRLIAIGSGEIEKNEKILFAGQLPHYLVPKFLNASDVFVFPTKAEGASNALLEAMACGLPVITSDIPEVISQIGLGNAVFIPPDDIGLLIQNITLLKENKNLLEEYSKRSLELISKYSIDARANNIIDWLNNNIL